MEADISIWRKPGHFYFALTREHSIHALEQFDHLSEKFSQPFIALRITFYYNMPSEKHQRADSTKSTRTLD
jgi:hypothetical protein